MKQQQEIINADVTDSTGVTSPLQRESVVDGIDDADVGVASPFLTTPRESSDVDLEILLDDDVDATSATFTASGATVTSIPMRRATPRQVRKCNSFNL